VAPQQFLISFERSSVDQATAARSIGFDFVTLVQCDPSFDPSFYRHFGGVDVFARMSGLNEATQLLASFR
jgi:hypothetical protein